MRLTAVSIFFFVLNPVISRKQPLEYNSNDYLGNRARSVIRLYYHYRLPVWVRQPPGCYGVLIDWQKAVVPCSCVSYTPNDDETRSPFNHPHPKPVTVIDHRMLQVGILYDELSLNREGDKSVNVTKITISRRCDSSYQVNYAVLDLSREIHLSKLAWINSPIQAELKAEIDSISVRDADDVHCEIMRWTNKSTVNNKFPLVKVISLPPGEWALASFTVHFENWFRCLGRVCPAEHVMAPTPLSRDHNECVNKINGSRICMNWHLEESLCNQLPGTPVFCETDFFKGVVGLIHNTTFDCPEDRISGTSGIVAGFSDIVDLISQDLRVWSSPKFSALIPHAFSDAISSRLVLSHYSTPIVLFLYSCIFSN